MLSQIIAVTGVNIRSIRARLGSEPNFRTQIRAPRAGSRPRARRR